jgi:GT2 family glycosyltransferase
VAFVDAVCLCISRRLLEAIGGLDEGYGFYHGIDRDLSLAVADRDRRCLIVHAPFWHHGGKTRTRGFDEDPGLERADLARRDLALARFAEKYRHRLPLDVRGRRERVRDWVRTRLA